MGMPKPATRHPEMAEIAIAIPTGNLNLKQHKANIPP